MSLLHSKKTVRCSHTYRCVLNFSTLLSVHNCHVGNQFAIWDVRVSGDLKNKGQDVQTSYMAVGLYR